MSGVGEADDRAGRIVVGVDGSPASARALRWAVDQARQTGAEVDAVIAWTPPNVYAVGPALPHELDWAADCGSAIDETCKRALDGADDGAIRRLVVRGHPAQVLVDQAKGADLLVVGSRGHGGFTGMLLGSVSQHVIALAPCPVVVVPDRPHN